MMSLAERAGIPIQWNGAGDDLIFDPRLTVKEIKSRLRGELRPVLPDEASCAPASAVQYWMYNGISLPEHHAAFAELDIQYELTLLYPTRLGAQRSKTLGHIHTFPPNGKHNYAEVCEVLWGEAVFLFQTLEAKRAPFTYAVHAKAGDKVVFPPNLHHLTVNVKDEMMLFADLICLQTRGDYTGLSAMQGGAYLCEETGWRANPSYNDAAPFALWEAVAYPGLLGSVPLYELIWRAPEQLQWLNEPESFAQFFPQLAAQMPAIF